MKAASIALPLLLGTAATSAGARAIGSHVSNIGDAAMDQGHALKEHLFAQTGEATDNPLFYPLLLATVLGSGYAGYKGLDDQLDSTRKQRATRSIAQAKAEFERALSTQYQQAQMAAQAGVKISAHHAGVVADALARSYISGELDAQLDSLTKMAGDEVDTDAPIDAAAGDDAASEPQHPWTYGAGNKALGIYLATLALLAAAGAGAGYHGVKAYETPRRKYDVAKELLRRRALGTPPVVTTEA